VSIVAQIIKKVNTVFEPNFLKTIARETKFIRRERIIKPKEFLANHLFLELEEGPNSLTDVLVEFNKDNISLTKQGLNKRYTQEACDFFQRVLEELINFSTEENLVLKSVPFVKNIKVTDSSTISLNKHLTRVFPGLRNHGATLKLQAAMNVVTNQLHSLELRPSRENDQSYTNYLDCIEKEELSINDLGYFCIDSFKKIEEKGAFFLSRFLKSTNVYHADLQVGDKIELANCLETTKKHRIEMNILLGKSKFKCRLIALRLPTQAYKQRIKNLQEKQRKNGHSKTKSTIFDKWTIFVTNLPESINGDTLFTLYSLRWQIELFFKMAKTFLNLRKINHTNAYRALISLYVSLIAITLLGLISMTIIHKEISFYKAGKILKKNIRTFFDLINAKSNAISWLAQKITAFALKETRLNRPSTRRKLSGGACF
jgi:cytochrome b561